MHVEASASPPRPTLSRTLLTRFPAPHWHLLKAFAARSPASADLAESFPLAFFLLATGYGPQEKRNEAIARVEKGRQLGDVARAIGLPLCLKRLPPEACSEPLPYVAWGTGAGRWMANQLPSEPAVMATWLRVVFFAGAAAGATFAAWAGRATQLHQDPELDVEILRAVAMYAWHSERPDNPLSWLAFNRFHPAASPTTVLTETRLWVNRIKLLVYLGERPLADLWVAGGTVGAFEFVPLTDFWQVMEERMDMRNCLDCYAERLQRGKCRLFGIRRKGQKIATVEIAPRTAGSRLRGFGFDIVQMKGPGNVDPPLDVWHAATRWLDEQAPHTRPREPDEPAEARWALKLRGHLAAYWTDVATRGDADPGVEAPMLTLARLDAGLHEAARRCRVGGWIFRES